MKKKLVINGLLGMFKASTNDENFYKKMNL